MKKIWKFLILTLIAIMIFIYFTTINTITIAAEMKIYFYLPDDWNSDVAYINYWNVPNDVGWPGYKMTFEREASGGKVYSYSLSNSESSQTNIGIVFSIGNSNYQTVNIDTYTMEYLNGKIIIPTQREYITGGNYKIEFRTYMTNDPTDPTDPVDPTDPTDPVDPTKPGESKNTANSTNSILNNSVSNKDSTIANTIIPKTGININIIIPMLLISICISIYFLIKYKQYKKI